MRHHYIPLFFAVSAMALTCGTGCRNNNSNDELAHHHHHHGEGHDHDHEGHEGHDHEGHHHEGHDHEGHHHEGHEGHNHGSGDEIILKPEQAKLMGVKVETVKPGEFNSVIKVSGEIVESAQGAAVASAPASGVVTFAPGIAPGKQVSAGTLIATVKSTGMTGGDPNAVARAAVQAAQKEVDRLKPLHEHGIVSTAEYNAALAALNTAKAAYSPGASSGRITAPVSGVITNLDARQGQFVDAGASVASISGGGSLTLRADLPQRHYGAIASLTGAKIKVPYSTETIDISDLGGKRIAASGAPRANGGYIPVYFSVQNTGASLIPGTAVEVYLEGQPRQDVITVPVSALSEQQGNYYVYIRVDEEGYLKSPVTLGQSNGKRVEITSGVHSGDAVVSVGATTVRLAESAGVIPEGHNHNH